MEERGAAAFHALKAELDAADELERGGGTPFDPRAWGTPPSTVAFRLSTWRRHFADACLHPRADGVEQWNAYRGERIAAELASAAVAAPPSGLGMRSVPCGAHVVFYLERPLG